MKLFKVDIHGLHGFTVGEDIIFTTKVIPLLEKVANSHEFQDAIMGYKFKGHAVARNHEIYNKFRSGVDKFNEEPDNDLDLLLTMYYSRRKVIGYTRKNTFHSWVNRRYYKYWLKSDKGFCKIVGNIIHEYFHNLGYTHKKYWNRSRKHTVPYAAGYLARDLARLFSEV